MTSSIPESNSATADPVDSAQRDDRTLDSNRHYGSHHLLIPKSIVQWVAENRWLGMVAMFIAGTLICWLRVTPEARNTLYAEDGRVFLQDWLLHPSPFLPIKPYAGYVHLIPRITQWVVSLTPISHWPALTAAAACAVIGGVSAIAFYCTKGVLTTWPSRLAVGLFPALIPIAGTEALGTVCNLHWWTLYAIFWIVLHRARTNATAVLLAICALTLALTEIQVAFLVPLVIYVMARERTPHTYWVGGATVLGCGLQVGAYLTSSRPLPPTPGTPTISGAIRGYLSNAVLGSLTDNTSILQQAAASLGYLSFWIVALALIVPMIWASIYSHSYHKRILIAYPLAMSVVLWFFAYYVNRSPFVFQDAADLVQLRWGVGAALFLLAAWSLALDSLVDKGLLHQGLAASLVVLLIIAQGMSFTTTNTERSRAPNWAATVSAQAQTCTSATLTVQLPIAPSGWYLAVPCSRLLTGS